MDSITVQRGIIAPGDKYNHGKVVHIDFTYCDYVIVWVQYKRYCKAYRWDGS